MHKDTEKTEVETQEFDMVRLKTFEERYKEPLKAPSPFMNIKTLLATKHK